MAETAAKQHVHIVVLFCKMLLIRVYFSILVILALIKSQVVTSTSFVSSCKDDRCCSYNGVCFLNECKCDPGWKGVYCEQLDLLPAQNGSGLSSLLHNESVSSWGGSVCYSTVDEKYHMFYSEMTNHCGIHRWVSNSVVAHAESDGPPEWNFKKTETIFPIFTHEPIIAFDPTSLEYVLFVTHYNGPASDDPTCVCVDGNSASSVDLSCANEVSVGKNKTMYSYFSFSKSPTGPWSYLHSLASVSPSIRGDLNLAPFIFPNHSLIAWTRWNIWIAENWRDVSTYQDDGQAPDWNDPTGQWEGEDPSMWRDRKGRFHILSHNGNRGQGGTSKEPSGDCGRHFFSNSGRAGTWVAAPLTGGGCAYPRVNVTFADGTVRSFYRRERPHLVMGPDGYTPVALTTSVIDSPIGPSMPGFKPPQRDASYTLVQAVNSRSEEALESMMAREKKNMLRAVDYIQRTG